MVSGAFQPCEWRGPGHSGAMTQPGPTLQLALPLLAAALLAPTAVAQRGAPSVTSSPAAAGLALPVVGSTGPVAPPGAGVPGNATPRALALQAGQRPVILVTGYWPPTNEAVRRYSQDPAKNPGGWQGSDWLGRGYDVISYFPEFATPNCSSCGKGMGDLEVDYQDTTADWATITAQHKPIAIVTLSRGFPGTSWEVESNQYNRQNWIGDYLVPRFPNPSPPDGTLTAGALRYTGLPAQDIVDRVAAANVGVQPFICESGDGGGFLSEFIAYLGVWYQAQNGDPMDPDWCVAAGHVHVGGQVTWPNAQAAVDVTLETLIDHLDGVLACPPMQPYCTGAPNSVGLGAQLSGLRNPSIANGRLELVAQRVPDNTSGLAFYGPQQGASTIGDGTLCVSGQLRRIPVVGSVV